MAYFLKKTNNKKGTYLQIYESYYDPERKGVFLFSFDKHTVFNLFADYPDKLTAEQRALFDKENPYWANFFRDR